MAENQEYTLSHLMDELNLVIRSSFDHSYWVIAELANVSTSPRGHMYMELVEKTGPQIIAKSRANLWSSKRRQIVTAFEDITKQSLKNGMKIMLQVTVEFHAVYGISFQVHDINPEYSLGELERQRQETIERLKREGLLDFNQQYILAPVIQNIAIISSETAAGYQDFINQLESNKQNYSFKSTLFPAIMQGEQAVNSIIKAADLVEEKSENYDALVIIRGGGSNLDLACFDDYELNARLAQSYFPVITGIGHERDQSVTDMIAHTRLKTPTAVAEFIIQHNIEFEQNIEELFNEIIDFTRNTIDEHKFIIERSSRLIVEKSREVVHTNHLFLREQKANLNYSFRSIKDRNSFHLKEVLGQLKSSIKNYNREKTSQITNLNEHFLSVSNIIAKQRDKLQFLQNTIKLSNPDLILKRGFSITRKNGKAITDVSKLKEGEILETQLFNGSLESKIINKNKSIKE